MNDYTLQQFINDEMRRRGLSEREFALFLGLSRNSVQRMRRGRVPKLGTLKVLAERCAVDLQTLVALSNPAYNVAGGRISPRTLLLAQRLEQLPQDVQDFLYGLLLGQQPMRGLDSLEQKVKF